MAPLGVYGLARVYWTVFHGVLPTAAAHRMLLVAGVVTAMLGTLMCFTQRHIKRLLAYSTIAHIGLFLIGLASLNPAGLAGSAVYLVGHAGVKGALFLLTGVLLSRYRGVDEPSLHGRARRYPVEAALFVLGALALAGWPPFGTGLGKSLIEDATGQPWLIALVVAVSAVTGGAALRVALRVYFGFGPRPARPDTATVSGRDEQPDVRALSPRTPITMLAAVVLLLGLGLAVGVAPWFGSGAGSAATMFVDQSGYVGQALHAGGSTVGAVGAAPDTGWTVSGLLLGFSSTALAAVLAVTAIYRDRLPATVRRLGAAVRPAMLALHRLHSGHLGDYAAWLVFGSATLAGLLALG
jgi:multicomponent Na+:H+ antiporter subunit D